MENLELRKQQDPALEKRIAEDERKIQEWMKQHPQETASEIVFPSLNNFKPTGNTDADRISYAKAKQEFIKARGEYQYKALLGDINPALNYRD